MARREKRGDALDRALVKLARVGRTKRGQQFLKELGRDHGPAVVSLLGGLAGKP